MVLMLIRVVNRSAVSFAFLAACRNILVFLTQHNAKLRLNHFIRPLQNAEGIVRPICLAAFKLMTNSNFVAW